MPNPIKALPPKSSGFSHPLFTDLKTSDDKATQLHRLLLDIAKDDSAEKEFKSAARKAADFFRETFFGFTPAKIKSKIVECFRDYFDGDDYTPLELNNISELTGVSEDDLLPVLNRMVKKGEMLQGKRRRHHEPGNHFNAVYKPRK